MRKIICSIKLGKYDNRNNNIRIRIQNLIKIAFLQNKVLKDKTAGIIHIIIFWGFIVLLISAVEAVIQGFNPIFSFNFLGYFYSFITFSSDLFCILIILAIILALIRRFVFKINRLQGDSKESKDALIVLTLIFIIVTSLLIANIYSESLFNDFYSSHFLSKIFNINESKSNIIIYSIFWWIHILAILLFLNYLPFSKHLHIIFAIPNVYFSDNSHKALEPINFEDENLINFGAKNLKDLSWKNILDSYSCTECGRCSQACPAFSSGMQLDPKYLIKKMREQANYFSNEICNGKLNNIPKNGNDNINFTDIYNKNNLWECTTCAACMEVCPVNIEHIPTIIEFRRNQVLMEADFPTELQNVFDNLENNANPWAFSQENRTDWCKDLNVKTCNELKEFDLLFWVGCAGAFDEKAKNTSRAMVKILNKANINFAILGNEEKCNGDIARRSGNEYLANSMINSNIQILNQYRFNAILTTCPHCYNTFKNEYPKFNFTKNIFHHTEYINSLIENNKLLIKEKLNLKITYHDSCYLSRYNNIIDAPRAIINSINMSSVIETKNNKNNTFCCGAGAGNIFIDNDNSAKINNQRTKDLTSTNCDTIALNCPFCNIMINDSINELNHSAINLVDLSELVAKTL